MILTEEMERTLRRAWEEAKKEETNLLPWNIYF